MESNKIDVEGEDKELLELQRRKSVPMVAITEFIPDIDENQSPMLDGSYTGSHKEVTIVEVKGDGFGALSNDRVMQIGLCEVSPMEQLD